MQWLLYDVHETVLWYPLGLGTGDLRPLARPTTFPRHVWNLRLGSNEQNLTNISRQEECPHSALLDQVLYTSFSQMNR